MRAYLCAARGDTTVDATIAAAAVATAAGARRRSSGAIFGTPLGEDAATTTGAVRVRRRAGTARRVITAAGVRAIVTCMASSPIRVGSGRAPREVPRAALSVVDADEVFSKVFQKVLRFIKSHSLDESNAAAVPRHLIEHLLIKPRAQAFLSFLAIFLYLSQSIPFFETADLV